MRTRSGWSMDSEPAAAAVGEFGGRGQRPDGAGGADRRGHRLGHLAQRTTGRPLGHDDAAGAAAHHVEHTGQAGRVDATQTQRARQDRWRSVVAGVLARLLVGVDEGERDLAVEFDVERLPELQPARAAVASQQPVAATRHRRARHQLGAARNPALTGVDGLLWRQLRHRDHAGVVHRIARRRLLRRRCVAGRGAGRGTHRGVRGPAGLTRPLWLLGRGGIVGGQAARPTRRRFGGWEAARRRVVAHPRSSFALVCRGFGVLATSAHLPNRVRELSLPVRSTAPGNGSPAAPSSGCP